MHDASVPTTLLSVLSIRPVEEEALDKEQQRQRDWVSKKLTPLEKSGGNIEVSVYAVENYGPMSSHNISNTTSNAEKSFEPLPVPFLTTEVSKVTRSQ